MEGWRGARAMGECFLRSAAAVLHTCMVIITTERLLLRQVHIGDLDVFTALFADPMVMRFGPGTQDRAWTQRWISGCLEDYHRTWGFGLWAVVDRAQAAVIGFCGLTYYHELSGAPAIELGYRLQVSSWGHGFGREAARAVARHSIEVLTLTRLVALIDAENQRSIRVARDCGLKHIGETVLRGVSTGLYAAPRAEIALALARP